MMDMPRIINMNNIQYLTWIYVMDIHDDFSVLEEGDDKMALDIPTLTENIKEIREHKHALNGEVAYYLSIAQSKIDDIDELDRAICDLERKFEDQYAEEGGVHG